MSILDDGMPLRHWVVRLFQPLLSSGGALDEVRARMLEDILRRVWMSDTPMREWIRSVRLALHLTESAFTQHPYDLAPLIVKLNDRIGPVQAEVAHLARAAWESDRHETPDPRFRPLLEFYQCLYERFYRLLIAPCVVADGLLRGTDSPLDLLEYDGRVSLKDVEKMESSRGLPSGLLTAGLERHLRNSIAHGRYSVEATDCIRMEDRNPRTKALTWGPKDFTLEELKRQVFQLHLTCEALLSALVVFAANNARLIADRDFAPRDVRRPRSDILQSMFEAVARPLGLVVAAVEGADGDLCVSIRAAGERVIDQDSKIIEGGGLRPRVYRQRIWTEECPLRDQVYALLFCTWSAHEAFEDLRIEYLSEKGEVLGRLMADRNVRKRLLDDPPPVAEMRKLLLEDSLPEINIPVVLREHPRPA